MKRITMVIAGLAFLASGQAAWSEVRAGEQSVSVNFGAGLAKLTSSLTSKFNGAIFDQDMGSAGFDFAASYLYQLTPNVGVGGDMGYFISGDHKKDLSDHEYFTSVAKAFYAEASARYLFMPEKQYHQYIGAGLGIANAGEKSTDNFRGKETELIDESSTGLAASI